MNTFSRASEPVESCLTLLDDASAAENGGGIMVVGDPSHARFPSTVRQPAPIPEFLTRPRSVFPDDVGRGEGVLARPMRDTRESPSIFKQTMVWMAITIGLVLFGIAWAGLLVAVFVLDWS